MKYFRLFLKIVGLILTTCIGYQIYAWFASANEIEEMCKKFNGSYTLEQVRQEVFDSQFVSVSGPIEHDNKTAFLIHSIHNFGRYTCEIRLQQNKVIGIKFDYRD
ncbi:hypothetical protein [Zooshikella sp. RANM57]|uniref:hypothetical protein n=1 Tax=Zooshikella sp. RANM57 TaxID=3425863 RepID=UPI003D6E6204